MWEKHGLEQCKIILHYDGFTLDFSQLKWINKFGNLDSFSHASECVPKPQNFKFYKFSNAPSQPLRYMAMRM